MVMDKRTKATTKRIGPSRELVTSTKWWIRSVKVLELELLGVVQYAGDFLGAVVMGKSSLEGSWVESGAKATEEEEEEESMTMQEERL